MKKHLSSFKIILPISLLFIFGLGYHFAPHDPFHVDLAMKFLSPNGTYPFGTDTMGRCILSRLLYGGRTTLWIIGVGSAVVLFLGGSLGMILGQKKTGSGVLSESLLNAFTAIPPMALLIVFVGAWGSGILTMMIALTLSLLMRVIKLAKTETEIQMDRAYVMCAISSGASYLDLLFREVGPNIFMNVLRFIILSCADMIMCIVSFSFIGLGLGDNVIDWGMMVSEARRVLFIHPQMIFYPIVTIFLCILSLNVLAGELEKRGVIHAQSL